MIRGAARGLFQSARQVRRAAAKQANKQQKSTRTSAGRTGGTRRTACEESVITNQQRQAFGRARYAEAMPRILSVGAVGMLDVGAIDALNVLMQDLAEDDDDGR
ncbi:hypothetical protein PHYSODRAFT_347145 [Phytophthora sojae]|uniref:Uncharacterized protein n=1 Tax=Phytophthora sojae (strain P6497) TaxID=1094619 RepID=G4ZRI2_PHYSP|nr:hypothetical protein PHYSODRAFT_347145 [Phytophthora sojae]EGZ14135.1 hypothetical protein PHYSODRAFT_347145 [Phytophthora sojae]|eukprot:XP_009531564.1 hypothetical protein PHYSODRAFT_347145 [Phytophthora sojae]